MDDSGIFIVGANGQLGLALQAQYPKARKADVGELDITNYDSVIGYDWSGVSTIINAAAYTNVDGAETPEGRAMSWKVNATAVGYLAEVARTHNITLVHISSDYVFDGTKDVHTETEDFAPLSVYGASKAAGDLLVSSVQKHYLLRTSWVIGDGNNFVRTMMGLGQKGVSPTVVADQIGRLTFTSELVRGINHLLTTNATPGTYNLSNAGDSVSWADITRELFSQSGYTELSVTDTSTEKYFEGKSDIAPRPLQSTLDLAKIESTGFTPRDWKEDLLEYIQKELNS